MGVVAMPYGLQPDNSLVQTFIAAQQMARQRKQDQLAEAAMVRDQRMAQERAINDQAEAARIGRLRTYRAGMISGNPVRAESAARAYQEADPEGFLAYRRSIQERPANGPELDPIGKRIILESGFQPGTPQYQARYSELAAGQEKAAKYSAGADYASKLRNEFQSLPQVKSSQLVATMYDKVQSATPTAAGDMALIFGYMKMLDPGSSVREGEYANASNSGSAPTKIVNMYNKILSGELLTPAQRVDFRNNASKTFRAEANRYKVAANQYSRLAERGGVDPKDVVLGPGFERQLAPQEGATQDQPRAHGRGALGSVVDSIGRRMGFDDLPPDTQPSGSVEVARPQFRGGATGQAQSVDPFAGMSDEALRRELEAIGG